MQNNNNNIDILFKEIKKIYIYKKFPKICVLRTKLNWITQNKTNKKQWYIFQKNTSEHFLEEKINTCIIGMAIILFYQIFFKYFCHGSPFELPYLLKIIKIIVAIWDNSCPMTQVLIFFFFASHTQSFIYCKHSVLTRWAHQESGSWRKKLQAQPWRQNR